MWSILHHIWNLHQRKSYRTWPYKLATHPFPQISYSHWHSRTRKRTCFSLTDQFVCHHPEEKKKLSAISYWTLSWEDKCLCQSNVSTIQKGYRKYKLYNCRDKKNLRKKKREKILTLDHTPFPHYVVLVMQILFT